MRGKKENENKSTFKWSDHIHRILSFTNFEMQCLLWKSGHVLIHTPHVNMQLHFFCYYYQNKYILQLFNLDVYNSISYSSDSCVVFEN